MNIRSKEISTELFSTGVFELSWMHWGHRFEEEQKCTTRKENPLWEPLEENCPSETLRGSLPSRNSHTKTSKRTALGFIRSLDQSFVVAPPCPLDGCPRFLSQMLAPQKQGCETSLVAPSSGWMLHYLCFSPSTDWEASHPNTGRSSQQPRSKPLKGPQPRDSGAIVSKTPLKQARNKNAIEAAILNHVLDPRLNSQPQGATKAGSANEGFCWEFTLKSSPELRKNEMINSC